MSDARFLNFEVFLFFRAKLRRFFVLIRTQCCAPEFRVPEFRVPEFRVPKRYAPKASAQVSAEGRNTVPAPDIQDSRDSP